MAAVNFRPALFPARLLKTSHRECQPCSPHSGDSVQDLPAGRGPQGDWKEPRRIRESVSVAAADVALALRRPGAIPLSAGMLIPAPGAANILEPRVV